MFKLLNNISMITVNKYRKKPVVIEAVKFDRFNNRPAIEFLELHKDGCRKDLACTGRMR